MARITRATLLDSLTAAALVSTLGLIGMVVWDRVGAATNDEQPVIRQIDNWQEFSEVGHRVGPANATVTIVEWGDYQCPACRRWAPILSELQSTYAQDVAIVYRHWPLERHEFAYAAARAAECAAAQAKFTEFSSVLYASPSWAYDAKRAFTDIARSIGIPNPVQFDSCTDQMLPNEAVERDIRDVVRLGGRGTPTFLVNDVHLLSLPDSAEMYNLVVRLLRKQ